MTNGTLTKTRKADLENGIEAQYHYAVGGMVYELEKSSEQYRYMRRNAQFASIGYKDVWKAYAITSEGLRYSGRAETRSLLLSELDERAARDLA